jgi:hypothetical protein
VAQRQTLPVRLRRARVPRQHRVLLLVLWHAACCVVVLSWGVMGGCGWVGMCMQRAMKTPRPAVVTLTCPECVCSLPPATITTRIQRPQPKQPPTPQFSCSTHAPLTAPRQPGPAHESRRSTAAWVAPRPCLSPPAIPGHLQKRLGITGPTPGGAATMPLLLQ